MEGPSGPLSGYLRKLSRSGVWKTRFFQQEASKLLYFEKDAVLGVIDLAKIVSVARKDTLVGEKPADSKKPFSAEKVDVRKSPTMSEKKPANAELLFVVLTADRQFVLSPVNADSAVVDYWVDGLNKWLKQTLRREAKSLLMGGARTRDARSASVGFAERAPMVGAGTRPSPPPPLKSSPLSMSSTGTSRTPTPASRGSSQGAVPAASKKEKESVSKRTGTLLRFGRRDQGDSLSQSAHSALPSSPEPVLKVGSLPGSPRKETVIATQMSSDTLRKVNRAKSMEDVSSAGDGQVYGAMAKLPLVQRENVFQMQRAFLDFRRLTLKWHLSEVHVRAHDEDALLLPELRQLEEEKSVLQSQLMATEAAIRAAESDYYEYGAELVSSFVGMMELVKQLNTPLQEVMRRLQELYKMHTDTDTALDASALSEAGVLVAKFRSFLPLLEDALVLDKPLTGRKNAMKEKLDVLREQNRKTKEQLKELESIAEMTQMDCRMICDFSAKAGGISELLSEVTESAGSILPWMTAPSSQMHASLSHFTDLLREETHSLRSFRDSSFLEVLERIAQNKEDDAADFELAEDGSLAWVTPDKMVELIVTGKGAAYALDFPKIFVSTYRLFLQPAELMEKLILIYCTVPTDDGDAASERKLAPCRLRILNLMKKWIHMHKYDFEGPAMSGLAHDFLENTLKLTGYERVAENLFQMLENSSFPPPASCPDPILPKKSDRPLELTDIDPLEMARQMTLDDMVVYSSLEARDFLNCAWSRRDDPRASPTIREMTAKFNKTAEWVVGAILNSVDDGQRVRHLRHFILVANELLRLNNFNSCVAILGSLSGQAVHRLHSWDRVAKEDMKLFLDMKGLISQNWSGLREAMATSGGPSIPLISPFLGDLTYIDEMKSRGTGKHMYNFRKLVLTSQAIEKVLAHVEVRYAFTEVPEIRRFILIQEKLCRMSADQAHAKSLLIQPRSAN